LSGTENSGSSASVAGPEAAMPAIVSTIQLTATMRLWARTQRVSEDTGFTSQFVGDGNVLYHKRFTALT
jgi:hypothetical protein